MPLHLLKLCVGADSIADLEEWIVWKAKQKRLKHEPKGHFHTTRMVPKRADELLDGGSLYWVIKGQVAARQVLDGIHPFTDKEGIGRCHLALDSRVVPVWPRPFRAFQGWRYLKPEDAPKDIGARTGGTALPEEMRRELAELGLL